MSNERSPRESACSRHRPERAGVSLSSSHSSTARCARSATASPSFGRRSSRVGQLRDDLLLEQLRGAAQKAPQPQRTENMGAPPPRVIDLPNSTTTRLLPTLARAVARATLRSGWPAAR